MQSHTIDDVVGSRLPPLERIQQATISLLISSGVQGAEPAAICAAADVSTDEFALYFGSQADVFVAIVQSVLDAHAGNAEATLQRRRSLTESLQIALRAVWDLIEARIDEHHALYVLMVAQAGDASLTSAMGMSLHPTYLRITEGWLTEIEKVHAISWELPVARLALLLHSTMDGLVVDYLTVRDGAQTRQLLDVLAFHLGQHGRRAAKNHPY